MPHLTIEEAIKDAFTQIEIIDSLTSTYKSGSQISRLNRLGRLTVSPQALDIVRRSLYFSELTKGALDITCKPIMYAWEKAEKLSRLPNDGELKEAASRVDYRNILIIHLFNKKGFTGTKRNSILIVFFCKIRE